VAGKARCAGRRRRVSGEGVAGITLYPDGLVIPIRRCDAGWFCRRCDSGFKWRADYPAEYGFSASR